MDLNNLIYVRFIFYLYISQASRFLGGAVTMVVVAMMRRGLDSLSFLTKYYGERRVLVYQLASKI